MYLEMLLDEGISTLRSVVCTFHMFVVSSVVLVTPFVTGYSKTNHNVTFGQLLFISQLIVLCIIRVYNIISPWM